jgi:hypothetical protein
LVLGLGEAREYCVYLVVTEALEQDFTENRAVIGLCPNVGALEQLLLGQAGPGAIQGTAIHSTANHQHVVAPAVIDAGVGIVKGTAAEFAVADQSDTLNPGFAIG